MFKKVISLALSVVFSLQTCGFAQVGQINLAGYLGQGGGAPVLDRFRPAHLRYFSYEPKSDNFQILLDKADEKGLSDIQVKDKADELMKYFRIGLSLPNDKFWVNLRPDAPEQIIDPELERTDIGKIMLEADLQLKKDTASFTSPQAKEGKEYWDKLYQKAGELFGTENITIPTITRPWIVPGEIIVRESGGSGSTSLTTGAYIYKAALKVLLEQDHLKGSVTYDFKDPRMKEINEYSSQLIRELIIPKLTKEVNRAKRYAGLRQVFYSLVLSRWFKQSYQNSGAQEHQGTRAPVNEKNTLTKLIDSGSLANLTSQEPWNKDAYYQGYKKSFEQGEYNLSETVHTPTGQVIRRYMSGGILNLQPAKLNNVFIASSSIVKPGNGEFLESAQTRAGKPKEHIKDRQTTASPLVFDQSLTNELSWLKAGLVKKAIKGKKVSINLNTNRFEVRWLVSIELQGIFYECLEVSEPVKNYSESVRYEVALFKNTSIKNPVLRIKLENDGGRTALINEKILKSMSPEEKEQLAEAIKQVFTVSSALDSHSSLIKEANMIVSSLPRTMKNASEIPDSCSLIELKERLNRIIKELGNFYMQHNEKSYITRKLDTLLTKLTLTIEFEAEIEKSLRRLKEVAEKTGMDKTEEFSEAYSELMKNIIKFKELLAAGSPIMISVTMGFLSDKIKITTKTLLEELAKGNRHEYEYLKKLILLLQADLQELKDEINLLIAKEASKVSSAIAPEETSTSPANSEDKKNERLVYTIGYVAKRLSELTAIGNISLYESGGVIGTGAAALFNDEDFRSGFSEINKRISEYKKHNSWHMEFKKGSTIEQIEEKLLSEAGITVSSALTLETLLEAFRQLHRKISDDRRLSNLFTDFYIQEYKNLNNFPNQVELFDDLGKAIDGLHKRISEIIVTAPENKKELLKGLLNESERLNKLLAILKQLYRLYLTKSTMSDFFVKANMSTEPSYEGDVEWRKLKKSRKRFNSINYYLYVREILGNRNNSIGYKIKMEADLDPNHKKLIVVDVKYNGLLLFSLSPDFEKYILENPGGSWEMESVIKKIEEALVSSSPAIVNVSEEGLGAVDFRTMDMLIQPVGSFSGLDFSPVRLSSSALEAMDLDKGLENIKQMASSSMLPSPQRLKEYISACIFKGKIDEKADDFILSMLEVFQLQSEEGIESAALEREAVVMADTRSYVLPEKRLAVSNSYNLN